MCTAHKGKSNKLKITLKFDTHFGMISNITCEQSKLSHVNISLEIHILWANLQFLRTRSILCINLAPILFCYCVYDQCNNNFSSKFLFYESKNCLLVIINVLQYTICTMWWRSGYRNKRFECVMLVQKRHIFWHELYNICNRWIAGILPTIQFNGCSRFIGLSCQDTYWGFVIKRTNCILPQEPAIFIVDDFATIVSILMYLFGFYHKRFSILFVFVFVLLCIYFYLSSLYVYSLVSFLFLLFSFLLFFLFYLMCRVFRCDVFFFLLVGWYK